MAKYKYFFSIIDYLNTNERVLVYYKINIIWHVVFLRQNI